MAGWKNSADDEEDEGSGLVISAKADLFSVYMILPQDQYRPSHLSFNRSVVARTSTMATVKARCQIMDNALPAGPLKVQRPFYVVEDRKGEHMIFCIDQTSRLCLIVKGASGKNELVPLHEHFQLGTGRVVTALGVSQNSDGKVNVVFSVRNAQDTDQLYVVLPLDPTREVWTDADGLKQALCQGEQSSIRVREIMLGTSNDSDENSQFYPLVYLTFSHAGSPTEDIWAFDVDVASKTWTNKKILQMPCNPRHIISKCVANLKRYRGLLVLYREVKESEQPLQMRFVGYDASKANPTLQSIAQKVPPGSAHVTSFENKMGFTDFLISGKGLFWLKSLDCFKGVNNGGAPVVLDEDLAHSDLDQFFTAQSQDVVSVWSLSKSAVVSYQEYAIGDAYESPTCLTPVIPLLDQESKSKSFSALQHPKLGQKLFVVDDTGSHMSMLEQDVHTAVWGQPISVMIPDSDQMIEFQSHTLQLSISKSTREPCMYQQVKLSSSVAAELIVNGRSIRASPQGTIVTTDAAGNLTIVIISSGLSTPILTINNPKPDQKIFDKPVEIDPMQKLWSEMDKINSSDDLRNMKMPNGKSFIKPGMSDAEVNNAYEGLQKLKATRRNMRNKTQKPQSIASRIWGAFKWVKSKIQAGMSWVFEKLGDVWQFVVTVAGKVWKFVLENLPQIAAAIEFLLEALAEGVGWLMEKFGKYLGWDDIIDTKNMFVNVTTAGMLWGVSIIGEVEGKVDKFFEDMKQTVRTLKNTQLPAQFSSMTGADAQRLVEEADQPDWLEDDENGPNSPAANFGNYHLTHNGVANKDGDVNVVDRLFQRLESVFAEMGKLFERLVNNIGKFIGDPNLSFEAAIKMIGFDLLEDVIGIVQKIAVGILGCIGDILLELTDAINKPINIPVLTPLYRRLTKGADLTVLDLACLLLAIPSTLIYKAVTDGKKPSQLPGAAEWTKKDLLRPQLDARMGRIRQALSSGEKNADTVPVQIKALTLSASETNIPMRMSSVKSSMHEERIFATSSQDQNDDHAQDGEQDTKQNGETGKTTQQKDWTTFTFAVMVIKDMYLIGSIVGKSVYYWTSTLPEMTSKAPKVESSSGSAWSVWKGRLKSIFKIISLLMKVGTVTIKAQGAASSSPKDFWEFWNHKHVGGRLVVVLMSSFEFVAGLVASKASDLSNDAKYYFKVFSAVAQMPPLLYTQAKNWSDSGAQGYDIFTAVNEWLCLVSQVSNGVCGITKGGPNLEFGYNAASWTYIAAGVSTARICKAIASNEDPEAACTDLDM